MHPLKLLLPGLMVAATGVGAGDLSIASFTGSQLGVSVLWAVVLGGIFKFVVTEGLARWQLASGDTFLEGIAAHFGTWVGFIFLPYLFLWSFFVGAALMAACGVTLHALIPIFDDATEGKIFFGILSSLAGLVLVWFGGYSLFEKVMAISIGIMFVIVMATALILWPDQTTVVQALFNPVIADLSGEELDWTLALIGGVGGTLTILCYGYWIQEKNRCRVEHISGCQFDLAISYSMTVLFGLAMVIIGSHIELTGTGANLLILLSEQLSTAIAPWAATFFLIGALGAVVSSLLGVWQAVPYLFADIWSLYVKKGVRSRAQELTRSNPYKFYLIALTLVPMLGLLFSFKEIQKLYALIGSLFLPFVALALLILNNSEKWVGNARNRIFSNLALSGTLLFFVYIIWQK